MDLIFYDTSNLQAGSRALTQVEAVVEKKCIIICRSIDELNRNLLRPLFDLLCVVLVIADEKDLVEILALREVLHQVRVILILPDSSRETIVKAHTLRPRLAISADEELKDLPELLKKLFSKCKRNGNGKGQ
jgi:hypothetical protein